MRFWQNKVTRGATIAVLGAALLGCAGSKKSSSEGRAEAKFATPQLSSAEGFTTKGKPTKTIETPWGPREVFDPKYYSGVSTYYSYLREISNKSRTNAQSLKLQELFKSVRDAQRIQALDYARHQCMQQRYAGCAEVDFVFKANCGEIENLHSSELSECESQNYITLWPSVSRCSFDDAERFHLKVLTAPTLDEALDIALSRECKIWSGESGEDFWEKDVVKMGVIPRTR